MNFSYLEENIAQIKYNIEQAAKKSGRNAEDVTLVAVSKTVGADAVRAAYKFGVTDFGENRVQSLTEKQAELKEDCSINWHMIGHLQTNKVKNVAGNVSLIHSLDSLRLAEEIDAVSKSRDVVSDCLIEINIAKETSKHGIFPENTLNFAQTLSDLDNIRVCGLMCVAPYTEKGENNRKYFEKMRKILIDIVNISQHNIDKPYLSMGMTGDYQVAIEEGANIVRVGTGLFSQAHA